MHELAIAQALVEEVQRLAEQQRAEAVLAVAVSVGALSGVDREALAFAFPLAALDTALEHTRLDLEEAPALGTCEDCGQEYTLDLADVRCTRCRSGRMRIVAGRDVLICSVQLRCADPVAPASA
jgi:hydrogenase nickel incorporation protein HypA/HybF